MKWLRQKRRVASLNQQLAEKIAAQRVLRSVVKRSAAQALSAPGARTWAFSLGLLTGMVRSPGSRVLGAMSTFVRSSLFFVQLTGGRS